MSSSSSSSNSMPHRVALADLPRRTLFCRALMSTPGRPCHRMHPPELLLPAPAPLLLLCAAPAGCCCCCAGWLLWLAGLLLANRGLLQSTAAPKPDGRLVATSSRSLGVPVSMLLLPPLLRLPPPGAGVFAAAAGVCRHCFGRLAFTVADHAACRPGGAEPPAAAEDPAGWQTELRKPRGDCKRAHSRHCC
jgi:hypothetical protein